MASHAEIMLRVKGTAKSAQEIGSVDRAVSGLDRSMSRSSRTTDMATRRVGAFRGGMVGMMRPLSGLKQRLGGVRAGMGGLLKTTIAFTGALAVMDQLKASVATTQTVEKAFLGLSRTMSGSDQEIGQWAGILASRNVDVGKFTMGLTRLSSTVMKARSGNRDAASLLAEMGVSGRVLRQGKTTEILKAIADGYQAMPDKMARADAMQRLFGRSARDLAPILAGGSKGLEEQARMMDRYGITAAVGGNGTKDLIKAQRESSIAMLGFQLIIGQRVIPAMVWLQRIFVLLLMKFRVGKGIFGDVRAVAGEVAATIQDLAAWFMRANTATKVLIVGAGALFLLMQTNPITQVVTALTLLATGLRWAYQHNETFRAAVDKLWAGAKAAFRGIAAAWGWVVTAAKNAWGFIKPIIDAMISGFEKAKSMLDAISPNTRSTMAPGMVGANQSRVVYPGTYDGLRPQTVSPVAPVSAPRGKIRQQEMGSHGGGGTTTIVVPVHLDGRLVAESTVQHVARKAARR